MAEQSSMDRRHLAVSIRIAPSSSRTSTNPRWMQERRTFVDDDDRLLRTTLSKFDVEFCEDDAYKIEVKTSQEMQRILTQLSQKDFSAYKSLTVIITGYGFLSLKMLMFENTRMVFGLPALIKYFKDCKSLLDKPKLFLIQGCDHKTYPFKGAPEQDDCSTETDGGDSKFGETDFKLAWCSVPGKIDWRPEAESMFFQYFCDEIDQCEVDSTVDVEAALVAVNNRMGDTLEKKARRIFEEAGKICVDMSGTLTKKILFTKKRK